MVAPMVLTVTAPFALHWMPDDGAAPAPGEVRVRTLLSAISVASELSVVERGPFPSRLGYQTLGVVEAAGADVTLPLGTRVVTTAGHTEFSRCRAETLITVPDHISDRVALLVILGEETHKGIRKVQPRPDEQVLVVGAGMLGLLSVFNLTRRGIKEVTVLEPDADRRELAQLFGAAQVHALGGLPHDHFDVALECSASPAGFTEGLNHLRPGGRCAVLSDGNWGALTLPPAFHQRELSLWASSDGEDYPAYARWLWEHAEPVLELVFQEVITPDELPTVYARLRDVPRPVSVLVEWQDHPQKQPLSHR